VRRIKCFVNLAVARRHAAQPALAGQRPGAKVDFVDLANREAVGVDREQLEMRANPRALARGVDRFAIAANAARARELEPFGAPQLAATGVDGNQAVAVLRGFGGEEDFVARGGGALRRGMVGHPAAWLRPGFPDILLPPGRIARIVDRELVA
jgi:hypothetical protein